ncbi:hypothetical protein [Paenibacillus hamazuiensis]|uniref:hypothetical protein n=1 Tax=Paenibacillus hamazuiensis TaxID=2936508 RepID=UPI00200E210C|nr:hypothetical protein [Paenibacillus hamazuiensis]
MKSAVIPALLLSCLLWCSEVQAEAGAPAVPGTYAGANLPWSTASPPQIIYGPGIYTTPDGKQVDLYGYSGGRWGATGDETRALAIPANGQTRGYSPGWLGLLGIAGLAGLLGKVNQRQTNP